MYALVRPPLKLRQVGLFDLERVSHAGVSRRWDRRLPAWVARAGLETSACDAARGRGTG